MARSGVKWFRGPSRLIPLGVGLVCVVLALALQDLSGVFGVAAVLAVVVYLGQTVPAHVRERQDVTGGERGKVRATTPTATGTAGGVATVGDTPHDFFSPRPTLLEVSYQSRDVEVEAGGVLAAGEPLLLVGPSMAGKSRLGEHLLRAGYAELPLWVPQPKELPDLLKSGAVGKAVIWLDELDHYLNVDDLRTDWVQVLRGGGTVVVATMRSNEYARMFTSGEIRHQQTKALEAFTRVDVRDDDPDENARLAQVLPSPEHQETVRAVGLGAFLGGGPLAVNRFKDNRDIQPLGTAIVRAAADWRRTGLTTITRPELEKIAPSYLPARYRFEPLEPFDPAMGWATECTSDLVQLLSPAGPGQFVVTDYLLDEFTDTAEPIETITWQTAGGTQNADHIETISVGINAFHAQQLDVARGVFVRVLGGEDRVFAAVAAFSLGMLEQAEGEVKAARAAFALALAKGKGEAEIEGRSGIALGELERKAGNLDAARAAWNKVIKSKRPSEAATAGLTLGKMEHDQGNLDAARAAWQNVIGSECEEEAAIAGLSLGLMEREAGNVTAARVALLVATDGAIGELAVQAALILGLLERGEGNLEAARGAWQKVIASTYDTHAAKAAVWLGLLEEEQGNVTAARTAYEIGATYANQDTATEATQALMTLNAEHPIW